MASASTAPHMPHALAALLSRPRGITLSCMPSVAHARRHLHMEGLADGRQTGGDEFCRQAPNESTLMCLPSCSTNSRRPATAPRRPLYQ